MPRKKISRRQGTLNKSIHKLKDFDAVNVFKKMSPRQLQKILSEIWLEKDLDSFKGVLSAYLNAHNKQKIAKAMGMSRNTLYHMVSDKGNPTIETVFKLLDIIEKEAA